MPQPTQEPSRDSTAGLQRLGYELEMAVGSRCRYDEAKLAETKAQDEGRSHDRDRHREEANAFLESLLLHTRNLIDFFLWAKPWPDDLHRMHYHPAKDWNPAPQDAARNLQALRDPLHKRLAHLTWAEHDSWDHATIARDLVSLAEAWHHALSATADPALSDVLHGSLQNCKRRLAETLTDSVATPGLRGLPDPRASRGATGPSGATSFTRSATGSTGSSEG